MRTEAFATDGKLCNLYKGYCKMFSGKTIILNITTHEIWAKIELDVLPHCSTI